VTHGPAPGRARRKVRSRTTHLEAEVDASGVPGPALAGPGFFRAVAIDFDGTLTMGGRPEAETIAALLSEAEPGQAVLVSRERPGTGLVFSIGRRETAHMRHWHKYSGGQLSADRRFYFRRDRNTPTGTSAGSTGELEHADFSCWVAEVLGDPPLAAAIAEVEQAVRSGAASAVDGRSRLISVIHERYRDGD
jgi:hypothetical protein